MNIGICRSSKASAAVSVTAMIGSKPRADRTAEADRGGAAHDRSPAVVGRDARIAARHGVQHARDPFRDVVAHDVFDEERRQDDAYRRVDQQQEMCAPDGKPVDQAALDRIEQDFEDIGAQPGQQSDDHGQQHHDLAVAQPARQAVEEGEDALVSEIPEFHGRLPEGVIRVSLGRAPPARRSGRCPRSS